MERLALFAGYAVVFLVSCLGLAVLFSIVTGKIDLKYLISESNGGASFSRFQFLIFTLVISMAVLVLTLESGEFPALGADVLALLGLSSGTYAVSKGIQKAAEGKREAHEGPPTAPAVPSALSASASPPAPSPAPPVK